MEAKDVNVSLDKTEETDQLGRYFNSLENLILTDYWSSAFIGTAI